MSYGYIGMSLNSSKLHLMWFKYHKCPSGTIMFLEFLYSESDLQLPVCIIIYAAIDPPSMLKYRQVMLYQQLCSIS